MTSPFPTQFTPEALASAFSGVPMFNGDINIILTSISELIRVRQPAAGDQAAFDQIAADSIALSNAVYDRLEQQFGDANSADSASANAATSRGGASLGELESRA
tara:strand:- start:36242 stop:36553 length:312 start_codon:yes stop_codon:yes gene_type:complete